MKRFRILSAALTGTFVYVFISVFAGRDGLLAERQQREQKRILAVRTESIQKTNNSLKLECTALQNDKEVIDGWIAEVKEAFPDFEVDAHPLSLSVACHIGPGALAIACEKKSAIS